MVNAQSDMEVSGIVKRNPTAEALIAASRGFRIYTPDAESQDAFNKAYIKTAGNSVKELLEKSDIAIIATPDGKAEEYVRMCRNLGLPAIIQGGEDHELAEVSFNAAANYSHAIGKKVVRVVSCNTTALVRLLHTLDNEYGVEEVNATIIRRAADPNDIKTGPINALIPEMEISSHHGPDVLTILPHINITTMAVKASTTLMHLHALHINLLGEAMLPQIIEILEDQPRIRLIDGKTKIKSTAEIMEYSKDLGRPRGDMWENAIWKKSITLSRDNNQLYLFQAVHQESIVVPENVDAIRAVLELESDGMKSIKKTNKSMGLTK